MDNNLDTLIDCNDGVVSVPAIAEFFGMTEANVRSWASENGVPRAGNSYAFLRDHVEALAGDIEEEEENDEEEDDDDDADDEHECD